MEKIIKEGKELETVLEEILTENNLSKEDIIYTSKAKKGKLFQGDTIEVSVYQKKDIIEFIKESLKKIIENMGIEVSFEVITIDGRTTIKMYTNNDPIVIGRNGATIKALETIVKQIVQNKTGIYYQINLDVSDYKDKIRRRLEFLAKRTAKEVARTQASVVLDNMNSYERRIIHEILADSKDVKTESEGEEPNRHVIIKPL